MRLYRWLLCICIPRRFAPSTQAKCPRSSRASAATLRAPSVWLALWSATFSRNAVERGGRALGHPAAGPSLRRAHAGAYARVHSDGHRDCCLGHRREHSGVFGDRFRPHPPAAVSAAGSAGEDLGERAGLLANGAFSGELPRLEESQHLIRRVRHVHHRAVELDRAGRTTAA